MAASNKIMEEASQHLWQSAMRGKRWGSLAALAQHTTPNPNHAWSQKHLNVLKVFLKKIKNFLLF